MSDVPKSRYEYGLACYPSDFLGYVVSENKICLQYKVVDVKLRTLGKAYNMLPKFKNTTQPMVPVTTSPDTFEIVAVGCQMPVLRKMQFSLLQGLIEHYNTTKQEEDLQLLADMSVVIQEALNKK
jgi:hypothetical protein